MLALLFINGNYYYCWHGGAIPSGVEEPWRDFLRVGGYLEWPPSSPLGTSPLGHSLTAHLQGAPFTLLLLMICVLIRTIFLADVSGGKGTFSQVPMKSEWPKATLLPSLTEFGGRTRHREQNLAHSRPSTHLRWINARQEYLSLTLHRI